MLGGGQLGRMFSHAAKRMGYKVVVFSPEAGSPAGQVADSHVVAPYDDVSALRRFSNSIDVSTIEFENIPVETLEQIEKEVPTRPSASILRLIQNRIGEKTFLSNHGFPVAKFHAIRCPKDIASVGLAEFPAVLKTCGSGYDGKGQQLVNSSGQLLHAWNELDNVECVLESFVDFECEFSVIVARNFQSIELYQPIRNDHTDHILDVSSSPAHLPVRVCDEAIEVARGVAEALEFVGVMCVEFFLRRDGAVIINEIAPRPHNSGHLTIEAHATSQFQQQVRAVCNLPLGSTVQHAPAAMANLLGDVWSDGTPNWSRALTCPDATLHLYGKSSPRIGRKMGHITHLSDSANSAIARTIKLRDDLKQDSVTDEPVETNSPLIFNRSTVRS